MIVNEDQNYCQILKTIFGIIALLEVNLKLRGSGMKQMGIEEHKLRTTKNIFLFCHCPPSLYEFSLIHTLLNTQSAWDFFSTFLVEHYTLTTTILKNVEFFNF